MKIKVNFRTVMIFYFFCIVTFMRIKHLSPKILIALNKTLNVVLMSINNFRHYFIPCNASHNFLIKICKMHG